MNSNESNNFKSTLLEIDKKFNTGDKKIPTTNINISKYIEIRLNKILINYAASLDATCDSLRIHNEANVLKKMKINDEEEKTKWKI